MWPPYKIFRTFENARNSEQKHDCDYELFFAGLTNKKLANYEEALDSLLKMHAIVRNYPPVVYQIAHLYQLLQDNDQASEWWVI